MKNIGNVTYILLEYPEWHRYVTKRYRKFIQNFMKNDFDLIKTAKDFSYLPQDMQSIFLRIERELVQMKKQIDQKRNYTIDDIKEEGKREKVKEILAESSTIRNIKDIYPEKLMEIITTLQKEKSIEAASKKLQLNQRYILERLLGRTNPRKPCEKGALYYLEKGKKAI